MRKVYILFIAIITVVMTYAVPAKRSYFKALMSDNTYEYIVFCGDENGSYYLTSDGFIAIPSPNSDYYIKTDQRPEDKRVDSVNPNKRGIGAIETAPIVSMGSPKIPVILVNFSDLKLSVAADDEAINKYYDLYCNGTKDGILYTGAGSSGSVRDYFVQQSDSAFQPEFKIIGPVTLSQNMAYYGRNSSAGSKDVNFKQFCNESLNLAMQIDDEFSTKFDNDHNGTIDLAFFIFAGLPESDKGVTEDAIWPKELISPTTVNGITISVTACCSELSTSSNGSVPAGIGTMCHEVSHSLGLPDQYDTNYRALGMSYWSLMDSGNYCNNGKTPCGYTSYERDFLGWRNLEILHESTTVRLKPLEQGGKGYKIVNEKNNDEYYILENRQPVGWDNGLVKLGHGMLAMHVDYLKSSWTTNRVNSDANHQRLSFIPANNSYIGPYTATSASQLLNALNGQLYPGTSQNTELSNTSTPAAEVFNGLYMNKPICDITEWPNGDITFKYMPKGQLSAPIIAGVETVSKDSIRITWQTTDNAVSYILDIKALDDNSNIDSQLLTTDSLYQNSYTIPINMLEMGKQYACSVMAMSDQYLNSTDATPYIYSYTGSGIEELTHSHPQGITGVYTINGNKMDNDIENTSKLPKGIYIVRTKQTTKKIIIH